MTDQVNWMMAEPERYIRYVAGVRLRPYQRKPLKRILESIRKHQGDTIVLVFPRQAGKDELLVQLMAYLLHVYAAMPVGIVAVNPTYKPQTTTAMERFDRALIQNRLVRKKWRKRSGIMRFIDRAWLQFLSGDKKASTRGATASLALIVNEAQDIAPSVYGKVLEPMTASTNATRILCGTVWTSDTLLAREIRAARQAERQDGRQRIFMVGADEVSKSVGLYAKHVEAAIRKYGREHPFVKTQYFNEEIDARGGMFSERQMALVRSSQLSAVSGQPEEGRIYAFLIDVAGQEEESVTMRKRADGEEPGRRGERDAVTLRIVEVDLSTMETLQAPTYRGAHLQLWTGQNHVTIFGQIKALGERWRPRHIVIDATGVGEGLAAMLGKAFPGRVRPVHFTQGKKSELGYGLLAIINTGRFRDECGAQPQSLAQGQRRDLEGYCPTREEIEREYMACESEILVGPQKMMRWGVPEGRRDADGNAIHDDIPVTDSLMSVLDAMEWHVPGKTLIIQGKDPLEEISHFRE